jgi:hypothetical protein
MVRVGCRRIAISSSAARGTVWPRLCVAAAVRPLARSSDILVAVDFVRKDRRDQCHGLDRQRGRHSVANIVPEPFKNVRSALALSVAANGGKILNAQASRVAIGHQIRFSNAKARRPCTSFPMARTWWHTRAMRAWHKAADTSTQKHHFWHQ